MRRTHPTHCLERDTFLSQAACFTATTTALSVAMAQRKVEQYHIHHTPESRLADATLSVRPRSVPPWQYMLNLPPPQARAQQAL